MSSKRPTKKVIRDKFFAFLEATSLEHGIDRDHIDLSYSYGRNCLLLGWEHQPFEEAIKVVHEAYPRISEKTIGNVLKSSMVRLFHQHNVQEDADPEIDAPVLDSILPTLDSSSVNDEIADFLDLLRNRIKMWTAFVFLEGVELKDLEELRLGPDVTLYPKDCGPLLDAMEDTKGTKGLDDIPKDIERDAGHCHCYLTIDIEGEDSFVGQQAILQAQDIANVLNLYVVSSRHRYSFYERVGVLGQPTETRRQSVLKRTPPVGENTPSPEYSFLLKAPPARHHEINLAMVKQWKEQGLDKVLECVRIPEPVPGSAEARIRNAITWYGRAMNAHSQDEQFVGLIIALESLLVAEKGLKNITQRLADVVSTLIGTDFRNREKLANKTKELYGLRSRTVHEGVPISKENLFALNTIVANTIIAFVRRETPSQ